jgi:glycosyltransferase involved in cell wall biosynthesis
VSSQTRSAVLVVEDRAHWHDGHYPVLFATLAATMRDLGHPSSLLTCNGWALQGDPSFGELHQDRFGPMARWVRALAVRMGRRSRRRVVTMLRDVLRAGAIVMAARARARKVGARDVIVVSRSVHPVLAAVFADRRSHWVFFRFDPPPSWLRGPAGAVIRSIASLRERSRRSHGGRVRIVLNNQRDATQWSGLVPWLEPTEMPFTFCEPRDPIPRARQVLGLPKDGHVALSFGAPHGGKDLGTVWTAMRSLPEWHLVVAGGGAADAYRAANGDPSPASVTLIDGYVDIETRSCLYAAADLAIVSFRPGHVQDSGTVVDAIALGTPIVCSEGCGPPADLVRAHHLGTLFEAGDAASLVAAITQAPSGIASADLEAARGEMSPQHLARRLLTLLHEDAVSS